MEEVGGKYATHFSAEVTHLLVGMNPTYLVDYEQVKPKIINENTLQDYFSMKAPQFLEKDAEDTGMGNNLALLLESKDDTNIELALEIIKTGGVPDDANESLLVLSKVHKNTNVRRAAQHLLERYGDSSWRPMLADRTMFRYLESCSENVWEERLVRLGNNTNPKLACILSVAFHKKLGKGGRYAKKRGRKLDE